MVYHYLIAYSYDGGIGRAIYACGKQITHLEDIERIEKDISSSRHKNVVLINYQLMRTEKEPQAAAHTATA